MSYSFIVIDHNDIEAQKTIETLRLFPHLNCLGIFKNDDSIFELLLKKRPSLVIIAENSLASSESPLNFDSISRIHEVLTDFTYFIYLSSKVDAALQAIQSGFSDYLITPLKIPLLGSSIARFKNRVPVKTNPSLAIKSYSDYKFIKFSEIVYLKADNNTTDIVLLDSRIVAAFNTLKYYQQNLPLHFVRIHKSYIVNIEAVHRIHFSHAKCYLTNGEIIPISPNYRASLDYILEQLHL